MKYRLDLLLTGPQYETLIKALSSASTRHPESTLAKNAGILKKLITSQVEFVTVVKESSGG